MDARSRLKLQALEDVIDAAIKIANDPKIVVTRHIAQVRTKLDEAKLWAKDMDELSMYKED